MIGFLQVVLYLIALFFTWAVNGVILYFFREDVDIDVPLVNWREFFLIPVFWPVGMFVVTWRMYDIIHRQRRNL